MNPPIATTPPAVPAGNHLWATLVLPGPATTPEEIEKYEKYLDRTFIRVDANSEPDKKYSKFIYKIEGIHMRYFGLGNDDEAVARFNVQKYFKNEKIKRTRTVGGNQTEVTENKPVQSHDYINGKWVLLDSEATFPMDCAEFDKLFKQTA